MNKQPFKFSIAYDPDEDIHIVNIDGHEIGLNIRCYYDEDNNEQIIDIFEKVPGNGFYRFAFLSTGQKTKIYSLSRMEPTDRGGMI